MLERIAVVPTPSEDENEVLVVFRDTETNKTKNHLLRCVKDLRANYVSAAETARASATEALKAFEASAQAAKSVFDAAVSNLNEQSFALAETELAQPQIEVVSR